jgi:hypothetical protein
MNHHFGDGAPGGERSHMRVHRLPNMGGRAIALAVAYAFLPACAGRYSHALARGFDYVQKRDLIEGALKEKAATWTADRTNDIGFPKLEKNLLQELGGYVFLLRYALDRYRISIGAGLREG